MEIPDCYDPVYQEEQRQKDWDDFVEDLPVCSCCGRGVYPHGRFYEKNQIILCFDCKVDLDESERILEVN